MAPTQLDLPMEARRPRKRKISLPWSHPRMTLREVALLVALAVYGRATVVDEAKPYALRLVRLGLAQHPGSRSGRMVNDRVFHITMRGARLVMRLPAPDAAALHAVGAPLATPLPD